MKPSQVEIERPERIGPYRILEPLGSGGMGTVWRAWDERLRRHVAVKQFRADANVKQLRQRLRREAQATARLNHPAIVHVYDIVEGDDDDWIVMELVEGPTLRRLLDEQGPLSPLRAVQVGREIASGLAEAHEHGILHRDLKTTNVIVTPAGRAKILDFGLAKELSREGEDAACDPALSASGAILGTFHAMSPEQALGQTLDARSDLFSLGSLLYETLTGTAPFRGESPTLSLSRVLSFRPQPLYRACAGVSRELSLLVDRLLEKDPRHRPQSALQVAEALAALTEGTRPEADGTRSVRPEPRGDDEASTVVAAGPSPLRQPREREIGSGRTGRRNMGERRLLTVVCCGLVGVEEPSAEVSSLDLEPLSEAMASFQDLAREVCRELTGHLGASLGHVLWLYFGYPQAQEDDALRAVRAARLLAARVQDLDLRFGSRGRQRLAARIAVHTGPAVVVTRPGQEEQLQLGNTLELATALQSAAPARGVVVSAESRQIVARGFTTEALPPFRLQGLDEPVAAWRVLGAVEPGSQESGARTPLIGRAHELGFLLDRFRLARSGVGQAVTIGGEAGIGKSRLIGALRERLAVDDPVWLVAQGSPSTRSSPLAPMIGLLERRAFESGETSPGRKLAGIEELLGEHGLPLAESVPVLAALLSLPTEDRYAPLGMSPEAQRARTFETLRALIAEMAERQLTVLLIEDLQWVDPSTLELLTQLLDEIDALPLLLVATFRPEFQAPWGHRTHITQLSLSRLNEGETENLIDLVAQGAALPATVRQQIVAKTDGVPLFVEELTKTVLESGWTETREIPSTLSGSLSARLGRLGTAREVAQIASAIGRTFSFELLQAISPLSAPVLKQGLGELVEAELVQRRGVGVRARYSFRHALIQDAAYGSLLGRDRQELHLRIASHLEEQREKDRNLLAHHWSKAMDLRHPDPVLLSKAIGHIVAAGEHTLNLSAYKEADSFFESALGFLEALPAGAGRDEQELVVQTRRSTVLKAIRGWISPEVLEAYDRARHLCLRLGDRPELSQISFGLWAYHLSSGSYEKSLAVAQECMEQAGETKTFDLLMARCALSNSLFWLARLPESVRHAEEVFSFSRLEDFDAYRVSYGQDPRVLAAEFSVWSLWHLGRTGEALARNESTLELAGQLSHPFSTALALTTAANFHRNRRDPAMALEAAERLIELSQELGFPSYEFTGQIARNWALSEMGRAAEVVDDTLERFAAYPRIWGSVAFALCCCIIADILRRAGRIGEALAVVESGLATAHANSELAHEGELLCLKGELLLDLARSEEAERELRQAFRLARERLQVPFAERSAAALGPLLAAKGLDHEAEELRSGLRDLLEEVPVRLAAAFEGRG